MRKIIIYLLLITMPVVLFTNYSASAKYDDGTEEEIPIQYDDSKKQNNNRSSFIPPVAVTLKPSLFELNVTFLYDVGIVSVKITNYLTGAVSMFDIDSKIGRISIDVSDGGGYHTISFRTEDGVSYIGHFYMEN